MLFRSASSNEEMGKLIGTDLKEGKMTLPLIHTMKLCLAPERERIKKALENTLAHQEDLTDIVSLIDKYQGLSYTRQKAMEYIQKAKGDLAPYPDGPVKSALLQLADYVIERRK